MPRSAILEIRDRIVRNFNPIKVILFGSYAYGKPTVDSDVDILVIMNSRKRPSRRRYEVYTTCHVPFVPMDVLVLTPREIRDRLTGFDPFLEEVLAKGRVIHERQRRIPTMD